MTDDAIDGLALERIDRWQRGFEERAAQAQALTERTAGLSATACEGDGNVEVTIGPHGRITSLRLGERVRRQPAATTARQILAAIRSAEASLVREFAKGDGRDAGTRERHRPGPDELADGGTTPP